MKRIITLALLCSCLISTAQIKKRVLFIGNSYTYFNDLPGIVTDLAASVNDTLIHDSSTPGGYTFERHSTNATSLSKIKQGNWDHVVLQEQSQRPSFSIGQVQVEVFPYAKFLDSLVDVHNPCAKTMFFMTWGRKNGDASNCLVLPPVCTYEGMDDRLRLRYMMMADSNDAAVSPVGAVWRYIRNNHPAIELYTADESHPAEAGSYAAACSFYTAIFKKDPTLLTFDFGLNATDAANIRMAAKVIVYDSLMNWHIEDNNLISDFSFTSTSTYTYQFTNQSLHSTGQIWNFGSETDTSNNPLFTFPGPGSYTVYLTSFNECDTIVRAQVIDIIGNGIDDRDSFQQLKLYPNPANNKIHLMPAIAGQFSIEIYNLLGEKVLINTDHSRNEIDVSALNAGIYFVSVTKQGRTVTKRLMVK